MPISATASSLIVREDRSAEAPEHDDDPAEHQIRHAFTVHRRSRGSRSRRSSRCRARSRIGDAKSDVRALERGGVRSVTRHAAGIVGERIVQPCVRYLSLVRGSVAAVANGTDVRERVILVPFRRGRRTAVAALVTCAARRSLRPALRERGAGRERDDERRDHDEGASGERHRHVPDDARTDPAGSIGDFGCVRATIARDLQNVRRSVRLSLRSFVRARRARAGRAFVL